MIPVFRVVVVVVGREGVMEMGDSGDVPGVTRRGACQEGTLVVNAMRDNPIYNLLRELGN